MNVIQAWKTLQNTALQEGSLGTKGSAESVREFLGQLGVLTEPTKWEARLQELLTKAAQTGNVSERLAATGIARSFRVLGTWGAFVSTNEQDKALCNRARIVSGVFLRSLSHNFVVKFADWLREKINSFLIKRSLLTSEYEEAFRRKQALQARPDESFDAVVSFADAGIRGELSLIEEKIKKAPGRFESLLLRIERFLRDVFPTSLSHHEDVARLQMVWRLLTREIDLLINQQNFREPDEEKLKKYAWQFNCVKKVLESHRQRKHWLLENEEIPFIHIKRVLNGQHTSEIARKVQETMIQAKLMAPMDQMVVLEIVG